MTLTGQDILKLVQMRDVFAMIRAMRAYRGTPRRLKRGRDRSLGPAHRLNSIHSLRRAVNKGFVYTPH